VCETGSLRVGSGVEAGGGFWVGAFLAADWGWATMGLFLVGFVEAEVWTGVFWGELEVGGDEVGAALVLSLVEVEVEAVITPAAATAAAREELGGEETVAG